MKHSGLTVAIDASLWDEPTTGIALYSRCLVEALERAGTRVVKVGARHSGEYPRGRMGRTVFAIGRLPQILHRDEAPLFHAVGNFNLPLVRPVGKALVLTVHDLIPLLVPESVTAAFRWQFRLWLSRSVVLADRIVCVSQRTRDDLIQLHPQVAEKIRVVLHGVDHVDQIPEPDPTGLAYLAALGLPERFVLYAGALDARKNVAAVVEACERLRREGRAPTLVLAGQSWFGSGTIEREIARARSDGADIRPLGYLAAPIFYALMRRATAFVFPSLYEGFGLPPLEAMRLGVPTIVSSTGALPEICGNGAEIVQPRDAQALSVAIDRLLHSEPERLRRAEAGRRRAQGFTWNRSAAQMLEVYREALQSHSSPPVRAAGPG